MGVYNSAVSRDQGQAERFRTVVAPQLSVRRGTEAVEFYKAAFGAVEMYRVGDDEVVVQLSVDGAEFWVSDESPEHANFSPESLGGGSVRMLLKVADPHRTFRDAVAAGATAVADVTDQEYGWLLGRIVDPFGHHWEIGRPLGPWPPAGQ
ncbi:MAG: VOC family protein [Candidatus Dormibacteraeota bacterium]|nr:VOC family protein [Candidatus Dormibacteraeota bacterium]